MEITPRLIYTIERDFDLTEYVNDAILINETYFYQMIQMVFILSL